MGCTRFKRMTPGSQGTLIIIRVQKEAPSIALQLLWPCLEVVDIPLIQVLYIPVRSFNPDELRHRFGQHSPVLLAFFELLLGSLLVLDIGGSPKPLDDLACFIMHRERTG